MAERRWVLTSDGVDLGPQLRVGEVVTVVEEPGHDEQTEACRVCGGRGWHTAGGNDPAACGACAAGEAWYGWAEWQPDPRTVAAVVEEIAGWLRRVDRFSNAPSPHRPRGLAKQIEERFKPCAPGGEDGH